MTTKELKEIPVAGRSLVAALFTLFYAPVLIWEVNPNGFSTGNLIAAALIVWFLLYATCKRDGKAALYAGAALFVGAVLRLLAIGVGSNADGFTN